MLIKVSGGLLLMMFLTACSSMSGDEAYRKGNIEQAAGLYKQEFEDGDADAGRKIGVLVAKGKISQSKYGSDIKWYMRSCRSGSNAGCNSSGIAFEYGKSGVSKDYNIARDYYLKAASKGYIQSQYNLSRLYAYQYIRNDTEGLKWVLVAKKIAKSCAAKSACQMVTKDASGYQNRLMNRMSQRQISQANKWAKIWEAK